MKNKRRKRQKHIFNGKLNKERAELIRLRNEYQIAYNETMNSVYDNLALFLFYLVYFKVACQQIYDNM